jgi:hypothetical protein
MPQTPRSLPVLSLGYGRMTPRRVFPPEGCSGWDGQVVGVEVELLHLVVKGVVEVVVEVSGVGLRSWACNAQGGGSRMVCKTVHGATIHAFELVVVILEEKKGLTASSGHFSHLPKGRHMSCVSGSDMC